MLYPLTHKDNTNIRLLMLFILHRVTGSVAMKLRDEIVEQIFLAYQLMLIKV